MKVSRLVATAKHIKVPHKNAVAEIAGESVHISAKRRVADRRDVGLGARDTHSGTQSQGKGGSSVREYQPIIDI